MKAHVLGRENGAASQPVEKKDGSKYFGAKATRKK
jgi:hypothetical protein